MQSVSTETLRDLFNLHEDTASDTYDSLGLNGLYNREQVRVSVCCRGKGGWGATLTWCMGFLPDKLSHWC